MKKIYDFYKQVKEEFDLFEKEYDGGIERLSVALEIVGDVENVAQQENMKVSEEEFILLCETFYRMYLAYPAGDIFADICYAFELFECEHMTVVEFSKMTDDELKNLSVNIHWDVCNGMM